MRRSSSSELRRPWIWLSRSVFAATAAHVGERAQVIVDGIEETEDGAELIGHAWFQAPDSDGAVHLDASEASVGDILTVEFTDSFCYELIGHVVE